LAAAKTYHEPAEFFAFRIGESCEFLRTGAKVAWLSCAKRLYFYLNAIIRAYKEQFGSIGGQSGWLP
jgi:hypothetical protein